MNGRKTTDEFLNSKITRGLLEKQKSNILMYEENYIHYKRIIRKYSNLIKELDLKNSLEVCILFTYLLWNGYFSVTKTNKYTNDELSYIEGLYPLEIMCGRGVCVNHSAMLRDFLNACGYESACLANIYSEDVSIYFHPKIKRKLDSLKQSSKIKKLFLPIIRNKFGNHEFNLINENGNLYIYDCTNMMLFNIRSNNKAFLVNGRGKVKLKPKESYGFNLPKISRNVLDLLCVGEQFSSPYTRNNFIDCCDYIINLLENNKDLLDCYYEFAYDDIAFIADNFVEMEEKKTRL